MKLNHIVCLLAVAALTAAACGSPETAQRSALRAPAYPLVSIDPYTSAWSMSDRLYDSPVRHWTGKEFPLVGVLTVDGVNYRFMGTKKVDLDPLIPLSSDKPWSGSFTTVKPSGNWTDFQYDDSKWQKGPAAFGTFEYDGISSLWDTEFIWVRREVELSEQDIASKLHLLYSNDDVADYYINGVLILHEGRVCRRETAPFPEEALKALRPGKNVIAACCQNTGGWAELDFGLMLQKEAQTPYGNTATQLWADVQATSTTYSFDCGPVNLELRFTAPLLLDDLDLLSRPVNYISYKVTSKDADAHEVSVKFEASPLWAVDNPSQKTESMAYEKDGIKYLKAGTLSQEILGKKGDDRRIDWGWFYLAAEAENTDTQVFENGLLSLSRSLGSGRDLSGKVLIGYDDIYSIQYFGTNLRPYWNRAENSSIEDQFSKAVKEYPAIIKRCAEFDGKLFSDAIKAGGRQYAELCALAYRQSVHAHKLVQSPEGEILWLSKENNSNGSIGTVDVTYPSAPLFLLYNPELVKGLMNHIYYFAESGRWTKPFPSHDVGTYPLANGQTYGGDMPIEEGGNMLILTAALYHYWKDKAYVQKHWKSLTTWTEYLSQFGLDPENQLCTDDFAGHFAHNANLSIKAILAIKSYSYLSDALGYRDVAKKYGDMAAEMASKWKDMASDGDHDRLTFDKEGTWSQKYNLVWDKLLGFNIFDDDIRTTEIAYYLTKQNEWGLPLDSRKTYTKSDWIMWSATMASSRDDFEAFIAPLYKFYNETEDRVPMSDWIFTDSPVHRGFKARSVVGGYFIKMLENK